MSELPSAGTDGEKLWLWRDGDGRFLAFRDLFPTMSDCGDPATLGQPCGYAIFHPMTLAEAQAASRNHEQEGMASVSPSAASPSNPSPDEIRREATQDELDALEDILDGEASDERPYHRTRAAWNFVVRALKEGK